MKTLIIKLMLANIGVAIGDIYLFVVSEAIIGHVITGFFSLAGIALTLLIKSRVEKVELKVDSYHKEVDGMKTALVDAVKGKGEAEGNLRGRIEQTQELKDSGGQEVKAESIIVTTDQASVNAANVIVEHKKEDK